MASLLPTAVASEPNEAFAERMERLEAETASLRAELQWLRENPVRLPKVTENTVRTTPVSMSSMADEPEDYVSWGEIQSEMKRLAWKTGGMTVVPYGILWGSVAYDTERTSPGPYTLFVHSADTEGEDGFEVDTRRTRAGLKISGPRIPMFHCAKSGGKLEIDFHGAFVVENKPGVLLRHAYGEVYNDDFKILAGQTWDVIAPLNPHTLNYSVGWGGGNIGYRRAQVRLERYLAVAHNSLLTVQGSMNQNVFVDDTAGIVGEPSGWPVLEGRAAWTQKNLAWAHGPVTLGVSGHIGEQAFDGLGFDDAVRRTWSFNTDIKIPITQRFGFQGEYFVGDNLGTFLGGVIQGLNRTNGNTIRSTGGWFEFWYDLTPRFHTYAGFGIDDPRDVDVAPTGRTYNHFAFATATFDVTKKMNVGMEVSSWKTMFPTLRPGEAVRIELTGKYAF